MRRYSLPVHGGAVALFGLLAMWTMSLVLADISGAIPGTHIGDNATGLWNVWWFIHAFGVEGPIYRTEMLFAPSGTQLSLHTHATTHSFLAWPLTAVWSVTAAHNLAILAGLTLNGICAWRLALRCTGQALPSIVAGALFALSAHVQVRVLGHINLVHAWVLPLFCISLLRLEDRKRVSDAVIAGAAAALVAYTDYYYLVYAVLFCFVWTAGRLLMVRMAVMPPRFRALRRILIVLILVDAAIIALIASSGGTAIELGPFRISARGVRNPLTLLWILGLAWALCRFPISASVRYLREGPSRDALRLSGAGLLVFVILSAPLWLALARVIASGDYTTPRVLWLSSPPGADASTLLLGSPRHLLSGALTTSAYQALGMDVMEQGLWLGLATLILISGTRKAWWGRTVARRWCLVGVVFFILALGPFLRVTGLDTALPLPQSLLRYAPGFGNARIPGRAVVMVTLAVSVLTAFALSSLRSRGRTVSAMLALLLVMEVLPAPAGAQRIPASDSIDEFLRESATRGAVAELPVGLRDGFGEAGSLDHRAIVHQLWHQRPIVGGFVARLSPIVKVAYASDPLLNNLLEISTPAKPDARLLSEAADRAQALGIAFVIVNRDTFVDSKLPRRDLEAAGFDLVQTSGLRELYGVRLPTPRTTRP